MKMKFLKLENWLLASLMGVLGLTSCHSSKQMPASEQSEPEANQPVKPAPRPRDEIRLMYGTPTMNFRLSGQVKDPAGKPVKGVAVNMLERGLEATADTIFGDQENIRRHLESTSVTTDAKGRFELQTSGLPQQEVRVLVRDVDGEKNGSFRNKLIDVQLKPEDVDRSNAGGWNQGTANKVLDIELERKK
ncbi:MAG: radical SAM-associated putative lipoprotein [Bacteroidales bacterium]|nr:radical SAM-associated putative lipoprotein [Bacteroidales bacterium]